MVLEQIRLFRLVGRGGAGPACDVDGVSLGGIALASMDSRAGDGRRYAVRPPGELGAILAAAYGPQRGEIVERCHRGLRRVASALEADDLALAGIEAVMLALPELDAPAMAKLARFADLEKGGDASRNEPRVPAGQPAGGQWTTGGGPSSPRPTRTPQHSNPHHGGARPVVAKPRSGQSLGPRAPERPPSTPVANSPRQQSRPNDPVSALVDVSNTVAGTLVGAAHWLGQTAGEVPIAPEIAAGDPGFPMGAALEETTDPHAFRDWRPVSHMEVAADALGVAGAVAPVARIPAAADEAIEVAGRGESVAAQIARNTPGVVTASGKLRAASGQWLRAGVPTPIPSQIAKGLVGRRFNTMADLRAAIWKAVANDPELRAEFSPANLTNMKRGKSPFAPTDFQINTSDAGERFHLHHEMPIEVGGRVYDLGNIKITDPLTHYSIHYGTLKRRLEVEMVERLNRDQLLSLMKMIMTEEEEGPSSEEINQMLVLFCANCPDPVGAMDLVVSDATPRTPEQIVDFALAMPPRDVRDVPTSKLLPSHPLRYMRLDD